MYVCMYVLNHVVEKSFSAEVLFSRCFFTFTLDSNHQQVPYPHFEGEIVLK